MKGQRTEMERWSLVGIVGSLILRASDSRFEQSHAIVIPRHIQKQRVKQDWSFSSYQDKGIGDIESTYC